MDKIKLWWRATRPFAYTVSVVPPILGPLIAVSQNPEIKIDWIYFFLTLLGCIAAHAGSNLLSDYFDYINNVDRTGTYGSSGVLVEKLMTPNAVFIEAAIAFTIAGIIGAYFIFTLPNGYALVWLILFGGFLGLFYTVGPSLKYKALGDFAVFMAFGPAMALGAYFVQAGEFAWEPFLYAIPPALLVDAVLHSNNLRDIKNDSVVKIKTIALLVGEEGAKKMYYILILAAYLAVVVLCLFADLTWFSLITFLSLPLAIKLIKRVKHKSNIPEKEFATIDAMTAQFHSAFSLLFILALIIKLFIPV